MSEYTMQIRRVCEMLTGKTVPTGGDGIQSLIREARGKIFSSYPIWDEAYRETLEVKILTHYFMREIGFETVALFRHYLNAVMNEIMPYYNNLYHSAIAQFDRNGYRETIVHNEDMRGNSKDSSSTNTTTSGDHTSLRKQYVSDTPQGGVTGLDAGNYLSNYTKNDDKSTDKGSGTSRGESAGETSGERHFTETKEGYRDINDLIRYNKGLATAILNIDMMIIKDLETCFFLLY